MLLPLLGLAACSFQHGALTGGGPDDAGRDGPDLDVPIDVMSTACAWSYTPTNFDPCTLPAPAPLDVATITSIDVGATTLPKKMLTQSDGTPLMVIHLSSLTISSQLTLTGVATVLAVDGNVAINTTGSIVIVAGGDNSTQCATARGGAGTDSTNANGGAGGGGGGGGAGLGGVGGNGAGTQAGSKGAQGQMVTSTLSPLRGGCRGGTGGRYNQSGSAGAGGRAGGALQISSNTTISLQGFLDASGGGGAAGPSAHVGAGGGGSGGGIFLEAPTLTLAALSKLCADGGAGGEGGGSTVAGMAGGAGLCTGGSYTLGPDSGTYGGAGGHGSYKDVGAGGDASDGGADGGGGGGGGGIGWIRLKSPTYTDGGAIITPAPQLN